MSIYEEIALATKAITNDPFEKGLHDMAKSHLETQEMANHMPCTVIATDVYTDARSGKVKGIEVAKGTVVVVDNFGNVDIYRNGHYPDGCHKETTPKEISSYNLVKCAIEASNYGYHCQKVDTMKAHGADNSKVYNEIVKLHQAKHDLIKVFNKLVADVNNYLLR